MSRHVLGSLLLGVVISVGCLWYAFRSVDLSAMGLGMAQAGIFWVLSSVTIALIGLVVRGFRWRFLLAGGDRIGFGSLVSATFIGMMANNLLPARLGEVVRALVLARRERVPVPTLLASVVIERLLDVIAALVLLGIALATAPDLGRGATSILKQVGLGVLLVAAIGSSILLIAVRFRRRLFVVGEAWVSAMGRPWALRSLEIGKGFWEGLCVLRGGCQVVVVAGLSLLVWIVMIASFQLMAHGFHLGMTPGQTTLVFVIVMLGVAIPSAPGFVGTFHGFCIAGLALVAGTEATQAAAYATLLHGSHWLAINMVGMSCLLADRSLLWTQLTGMLRNQSHDRAGIGG